MRTQLQVAADRAAEAIGRSIGSDLRRLREDSGLPKAAIARAAGIDPTHLGYIEGGEREASLAVLCRVSAALGADVSLRVFPNSGPAIRDRIQARMVEAFLKLVPATWDRYVEVPVQRPVRGVIDIVLARPSAGRIVAIEAHSELRRLEQQIRWAADKSDALPSATIWPALTNQARPAVSRILLLRSTASTRSLARSFSSTLAAAYPVDPAELIAAVVDPGRAWPGNGIIWVRVDGRETSVMRHRPRGHARPGCA